MMRTVTRMLAHCAFLVMATLTAASSAGAQAFVEYPAPMGGDFRGITAGPDGNLWVAAANPAEVARVTTTGSFTEFGVPTGGAQAITLGPDGNLWFTEPAKSVIGKVTTSGVVTEHSVPTSGSSPRDLTAGPDGNLWFTESAANKIGTVTTSGVFTEYVVPTTSSYPLGITAGPDGNLWFTETFANKVGRVTTAGAFTEFDVPTTDSFPAAIVAGPDGRLWFAEGNEIGAVTTDGTFTEYAIPSGGFAESIAVGSDGNLWFTQQQMGRIGTITTDGVVTEYDVPSGKPGQGITAGPDGVIWFAQFGGVARFDPLGAPSTPTPIATATITPTPTSTATPTPTATATPFRDAFACYQAGASKGSTKFAGVPNPPGLALVDRFGGSLVAVQKPKLLCAPTNAAGDDPTAPTHPEHLKAYQTKTKVKPHFPSGVTIVDRFNPSGLTIDVRKQSHLLMPVVASVTGPTPVATPGAFTTDPFECYQVKVAKGAPKFVPALAVPLGDRFGTMTVDVTKPAFFCAPTDVAGSHPSAPTHDDHLMCYKAKQVDAPKFAAVAGVAVNGGFGPETLDVKKPALLCVPARIPSTVTGPESFCDLPGSVRFESSGTVTVPGGDATNLAFLHLPQGFCAHAFANVGNPQQLRFAPGGELFAASPTTPSSDGGPNGQAAIVVLPDDDHDGLADSIGTFLGGLPSTRGILFANGFLYFQDGSKVRRVAYTSGDRTSSGASAEVADITTYVSSLNWMKVLDVADDGTIYVSNGSDQGEACMEPSAFHGGILELDGSPGGTPVVQGMRLPSGLRCARGTGLCFATEMSKDYSSAEGGRSKVVPIRSGDDWGFACCATQDVPFSSSPTADCSAVAAEDVSLEVGDKPNDLDFSPSTWPAPWNRRAFATLLGADGSWEGARMVAIQMDATTGQLLPAADLGGPNTGAMADFATGWDDETLSHGRPSNVAFAADGRMFVGNGTNGDIIWIAPFELPRE